METSPAALSGTAEPSLADGELDVPRFERRRHVEAVKTLSVPDGSRTTLTIAAAWLCIAGAMWVALVVDHWAVYILCTLFIGTRLQVLIVLLHEAVHYLLYRRRWLNNLIGDLFIAFPLALSTHLYRRSHFLHHRHLNTARDPDFVFQGRDPDQHFPKSPLAFAWLMLRSAICANFPRMLGFTQTWMPGPNLVSPLGRAVMPLSHRILFVAFVAALLAVLWVTQPPWQLIALYLVPSIIWANLVNRVRSMSEHGGTRNSHELDSTRTVLPTWLDRLIVAPVGVSYHIEHHLFPSVPGHRLRELHNLLMQDPEFRARAHITRSYLGVVRQLTRVSAPATSRQAS